MANVVYISETWHRRFCDVW